MGDAPIGATDDDTDADVEEIPDHKQSRFDRAAEIDGGLDASDRNGR